MKLSLPSFLNFTSTRRALRLSAFLCAATLPATFLLPGCGGGGGGNGPTTAVQAGGQVNLGNGQLGNLGFGVLSNDTVFGSFDIVGGAPTPTPVATPVGTPSATPTPAPTLFPVGSYNVSGNRRGNRLTLAGTIPDNSLISIDATLAQGTTPGSFTVKLKGQSFTGPLVTATPTPTSAPTATATATRTATATATPVVTSIP